jgi:hypothetical protein
LEDLPPGCDRITRMSRDSWSRTENGTYLGCSAGLGCIGLNPVVDGCRVGVDVLVDVDGVLAEVADVLVDVFLVVLEVALAIKNGNPRISFALRFNKLAQDRNGVELHTHLMGCQS